MGIQFRYELSTRYTDNSIEVFANEAPVGILSAMAGKEQLNWLPDDRVYNVSFQFRNEDTFLAVVDELKRYKNKKGYKYLTIWSYNHGYAELINKGVLEKAGFRHLPNMHPACMFLE